MKVLALNHNDNKYNKYNFPSFGVNRNSSVLKYTNDDFFVHITGYGKNYKWVELIKQAADNAVNMICQNNTFDKILMNISECVRNANQIPLDISKRVHSGILRTKREGWRFGSNWQDQALMTRYRAKGKNQYKGYAERLDKIIEKPLHNPYWGISLTKPYHGQVSGDILWHGDSRKVNNALNKVGKLYEEFHKKYIQKDPTENDLQDINSLIAEMRWILAHSTPWERGSDSIANTFMRALYKSAGIKTYPLRRGVSLDLEAYCTELKEYKANFDSYFSKKPCIVE